MFGSLSSLGAIAALALTQPAALPGPIPAEIVRVIDGDTIAVRAHIWPGHSVETRVRLAGIDTPEIRRPDCADERTLGELAARTVQGWLPEGATVFLTEVSLGSFAGRVVARLQTADGRDLSAQLTALGLAQPYGQSSWCPAEDPAERPAEGTASRD